MNHMYTFAVWKYCKKQIVKCESTWTIFIRSECCLKKYLSSKDLWKRYPGLQLNIHTHPEWCAHSMQLIKKCGFLTLEIKIKMDFYNVENCCEHQTRFFWGCGLGSDINHCSTFTSQLLLIVFELEPDEKYSLSIYLDKFKSSNQ